MEYEPGLDELARKRLEFSMREHGLIQPQDQLAVSLISGGRSNITYALETSTNAWVLRRPPLGHVLSTAHDMEREYRVLFGLGQADQTVPVPATAFMCRDKQVIGASFYVMERVSGKVLRTSTEALALPAEQQVSVADSLIDILAALHMVDPNSVGLGDFGRPAGFMQRQVARWTHQLNDSRSRDLNGIELLADSLRDSVPEQRYSSIVHGDYRLDNCLVRDGAIAAVLDWEMSTLGDPLSDLGLFEVYYSGLAGIDNPVVQALDGLGSYPPADRLIDRYASRTGHDISQLDWYVAFAWFKFAVILEGIHYRSTLGATVGEGFDGVAELVQPSIDRGRAALAGRGRR
ncbi:MAG TPA: phosphotransferase family protein [Mycobacterium sp.]|uniref:Putative phosphotransferase n=1 Tax=Rhodococcus wratislaviensis TaxID=44752 RepID=A0A402C5K7_RHOWR|nr:phosphotransferase family protein [Rhodococcus wratislaviensis]GCE38881.1 putative phosphotransferase [Rhodococcus wratislaviensis]HJT93173.1 phosphotransferase family protein [Mycobacterium sp.]